MITPQHRKSKNLPKILVVDDEPDNLDLLYRTFHRRFTVLRANDGATALQLLEQEDEIAVIISDQRMPQMSGTEFLSLTASRYPDTIRIILTGYTDVEDLVDAINAGKVFKYVTKPWSPDELKSVVQQAVDTHNVLRARTRELQRALRQESLLNAVTHQIRSASGYRAILQTIVEAVGQMFEVDCAIVRSWNNSCPIAHPAASQLQEDFIYVRPALQSAFAADWLAHTLWQVSDVERIDNARQDCRLMDDATGLRQQAYAIAQIASSLLVPLTYQQNQMAVLALHHRHQPHEWQDDEVNLICMVADQAALALAQAQAYEQVQALATRAALVNKITATIRSSLEPQAIFAAITQELGQALSADGCALSLWTEDDAYVQCVGLYDASAGVTIDLGSEAAMPLQSGGQVNLPLGLSGSNLSESNLSESNLPQSDLPQSNLPQSNLPQSQVPIAENPVLRKLLTTQEPVVIDDLSQQPQMSMIDLPLRSPARSLLVVPLLHDGKIIGSISLRQVNQPRFWETVEVELAQTVAAQAAIAVQQARLYQTTRQQAEQLLQLDRQKTEFFQNVSHEFRTPLTLTIGPLESAVESGEALPYDQAVIALRNSRRLLRLVNQLLDLQRLDAGRMQPRFRPTNLLDCVAQVVESCRPYCDRKQITLRTDLQPCPPIFLDLERFDKVLYNLLSNAMKFTPAGGTIEVSLSAGEECAIRVRDTGVGIQADQIPALFERFRQADGSTSRRHEGSGLGLALVKELVELHGGRVTVESTYGEGAVFTVWLKPGAGHLAAAQIESLPAELEPSRAPIELADIETELAEPDTLPSAIEPVAGRTLILPETTAQEVSQEKPARILVVEDNADMRRYISGILKQKGYAIHTARHGGEGLEKAKALLPDLIVTDLMMPLVSGTEMIHQIRQDSQLRGTPIVLLTAKADEDTRIAGTELGADAFLAKPFNRRELLAEVRNLLALKENERKVAELNAYLTESVLRRFLPPPLVKKAARGELALDLRPEPRMITVLFSDIIGFAQLSNTLRSRRIAELLNEYLTEMTDAIFANGGTVDKFMGDAILAIFGAPEEISPNEQVKRAIAAARQMYRTLGKLNECWQAQGISQVQFRCGIHQGTAVVGMFGGTERADYTAIGPSVNIAARIQEAAEPNSILVSAAVADYLELEEDAITKFSPLKLKGIDETVLTFSIHPDLDAKKQA